MGYGLVLEQGEPGVLLKSGGAFAELWGRGGETVSLNGKRVTIQVKKSSQGEKKGLYSMAIIKFGDIRDIESPNARADYRTCQD